MHPFSPAHVRGIFPRPTLRQSRRFEETATDTPSSTARFRPPEPSPGTVSAGLFVIYARRLSSISLSGADCQSCFRRLVFVLFFLFQDCCSRPYLPFCPTVVVRARSSWPGRILPQTHVVAYAPCFLSSTFYRRPPFSFKLACNRSSIAPFFSILHETVEITSFIRPAPGDFFSTRFSPCAPGLH